MSREEIEEFVKDEIRVMQGKMQFEASSNQQQQITTTTVVQKQQAITSTAPGVSLEAFKQVENKIKMVSSDLVDLEDQTS